MKIANINTIKDRATVKVPGDYGKTSKENLDIEWKKYTVTETKELLESDTAMDDVFRDAIVNIANLTDEENQKIEYSTSVLEQLLDIDYIRKAINDSFMTVQFGRESLKQKNS